MRFVKGDAIAGLLILAISLAGGLTIGVVRHDLPLGDAARIYTLLTSGDGLVSQLPALLISTAAGLVVTRVASDEEGGSLGPDLARQLDAAGRAVGDGGPARRAGAGAGPAAALARSRSSPRRWPRSGWYARRQLTAAASTAPLADSPRPPAPLELALDPALHAAAPSLESRGCTPRVMPARSPTSSAWSCRR